MNQSIYSATSYKAFILARIQALPQGGHGARKRLAEAIGCQLAYVSHVLNGERNFSVEQAEAAARFFGLDQDETEALIWLLEAERAGTPGARKFFQRLLEQKRAQYQQLRRRVDIAEELGEADKAVYYSDPLYAAVHMAVTVPEYRSMETIARRLRISQARLQEVLTFLVSRRLVQERSGRYLPGTQHLFISKGSPFILQHHSNWRMQALQSVARKSEDSVHLSMVVTLSESDARKLRLKISEFLEETSETIKASKEEKLMALNLDFFDV